MELIKKGIEPYEVRMLNLYLFMYADDTVLFSESITEWQKMIVSVYESSYENGLDINLQKTKIVVFRNRGVLRENEKWYLNGKMIEICNQFVYLGLLLNYNGTFTITQKTLSEQGRKATFCLLSKIYDECYNFETLLSLFDTYVTSIVNYGCEIWGYHKSPDIETLHLYYLKRILIVRKGRVNHMVYFELGQLP